VHEILFRSHGLVRSQLSHHTMDAFSRLLSKKHLVLSTVTIKVLVLKRSLYTHRATFPPHVCSG
jgi:hypothetical protein